MWRSLLCCGLVVSLTTLSFGADEEKKPEKGRRGGSREEFMKKMDKDGDGKLSDEEKADAKKSFEAKHEEMHKKMVEKFDKDGDGKLSDDEKSEMKKEFSSKFGGKGRGPGGFGGHGHHGRHGGHGKKPGGDKDSDKKSEEKKDDAKSN